MKITITICKKPKKKSRKGNWLRNARLPPKLLSQATKLSGRKRKVITVKTTTRRRVFTLIRRSSNC